MKTTRLGAAAGRRWSAAPHALPLLGLGLGLWLALGLAGCTLGGELGDGFSLEPPPPGPDPCEDCTGDDGGPPAPNAGDGAIVAILETNRPNLPEFILRGTFPVAKGTCPRPDGRDPFLVFDYDGSTVPTQTEIVSRYPNEADGADVVEVIARVRTNPGIAPGMQVRYAVAQSPWPAVLGPGTLGLEDLNATEQVPSTVQGLLLDGNGVVITATDCFGNEYVCRPFDHTGTYKLMRRGRVHSEMRIYQTMVPEPPVAGSQGTLPHFFGVHSYVSTLKNSEMLGLDLRFNNGHDGRNTSSALDNPLDKIYFEKIEISIPQSFLLLQDFEDPYFGNPVVVGTRRIYQLVEPLPAGRMHVLRWQGQFHRRLMLVSSAQQTTARAYLDGAGHAFCVRGLDLDGVDELWSWWNRGTARYFPQRAQLPALDHVGLGWIRSQLASTRDWLRGHLVNGTSDGNYPIQDIALGWGHPYGVSYGGMTGGSEIFCWDGVTVAASASVAGYNLYVGQHRMHTDRQPDVLVELDGEPASVERWLVDGPGTNDYVPFYHYILPFLGSSFNDPFGFHQAQQFQINYVTNNGLQPGYESLHLQYDPHDFQHFIRYTRSAKVLAWLGNDSIAKDDLRMQAEMFHLSFHMFANDANGGTIGSGMRATRAIANARPGTGIPFGRGEAWGIDVAVAAYATSDPAWRTNKRPWFEDIAELVNDGQGACNGFIQSFVSDKAVNGLYRARQLIEQSLTENMLQGLRETVFRGVDQAHSDMVRDVLTDSLYAFIGEMSWFPEENGPWRYTGIGPLNVNLPVWCSRDEMPPDAWTVGDIETYQDWSSFAYGYEITGDPLFLEYALKQFPGSQSLYGSLHFEGTDNVENFAPTLALVQHMNGDLAPSASTSLVLQPGTR